MCQASGIRVQLHLRLKLSGLRFAVSGFGYVVSGFGFRVSGFGFRGSEIVPGVSGVGLGIPVWGFGEVPEAEVVLLERCHNRVAHLVQDLI